jgi:putative membrane protein
MALLAALLHPLEQGDWLGGWSIHPSTVVGIAALGALYAWRGSRGSGKGEVGRGVSLPASHFPLPTSPTAAQRLSFALGLAFLFLSLNGPLHDLSDTYLFSAHMVQHLVLTMFVIPLLLLGTTGEMLRPALRVRAVAAVARVVTRPAAAFLIWNAAILLWHVPAAYDLAMRSHEVHIVQHLCFLAAATIMWWPILGPLAELPRPGHAAQLLYTFLLTLPMALLGMVITYAERVLYPAYQSAPRLWGITPMQDQLLGGLIMWIPGGFIYLAAMSVIFFRWAGSAESADLREYSLEADERRIASRSSPHHPARP